MSEEALARGNEVNTVLESTEPKVSPAIMKEAEVKLKEMSRKAKERKTAPRRAPSQKNNGSDALARGTSLRLLLIGGVGISVLGILYLMLRKNENEHEVLRMSHITPSQRPEKEGPSPKQEPKKEDDLSIAGGVASPPEFELNSF